MGVMEEKVKLSNLKNVDSTGTLHRKYQELLKAMQGKDELISQLEVQLEKQVGANVQQSTNPPQHLYQLAPSFLSPSA
jgi:predicted nucleic acid-binding protein